MTGEGTMAVFLKRTRTKSVEIVGIATASIALKTLKITIFLEFNQLFIYIKIKRKPKLEILIKHEVSPHEY